MESILEDCMLTKVSWLKSSFNKHDSFPLHLKGLIKIELSVSHGWQKQGIEPSFLYELRRNFSNLKFFNYVISPVLHLLQCIKNSFQFGPGCLVSSIQVLSVCLFKDSHELILQICTFKYKLFVLKSLLESVGGCSARRLGRGWPGVQLQVDRSASVLLHSRVTPVNNNALCIPN